MFGIKKERNRVIISVLGVRIKFRLFGAGKMSAREWVFGEYISTDKNLGSKMCKLLNNLSVEDQNVVVSDLINTAIRYKTNGKISFKELIDEKTACMIVDRSNYMNKKRKCKDYFELDGYKLPFDKFMSDIFYERFSLDKMDIEMFKNKDIIDAGACIGDSALVLSEYTMKNVYAFEPGEKNFNDLKKTVELNNKTNIVPVQSGLGKENTSLFLDTSGGLENRGSACVVQEKTKNAEEIKIVTLDSFVEENNLEPGFIKVDIEGSEQDFLAGAKRTIERFKPTISISIYHNPEDFFDIKPLIESWDLGYKFRYISPYTNNYFVSETVIIAEAR